ncbi:hypothetical protein CC78DRAFT_530233 [Lojkania enalia]|uniref:Uncharacterized protein n=1 Tax=Lojkania enalia TaxID=147567 RepID=A0A9P4N6F3_9PLEO|nr:hypothetical protein CC78DRAFT_530233 [Didymosphaeria enalia]
MVCGKCLIYVKACRSIRTAQVPIRQNKFNARFSPVLFNIVYAGPFLARSGHFTLIILVGRLALWSSTFEYTP